MRRTVLFAPALAAALLLSACDTSTTPAASTPGAPGSSEVVTAADTFALLDQANGFQVGKAAGVGKLPTAYVIFDPQCSHCAQLWQNAKPLHDKVLLKWIPVGMLNRTSVTQSAMLLEATDPVAMMSKNEATFLATHRPSKETLDVKADTIEFIKQNTAMLEKLKAQSVPTIVYRDHATRAPVITSGALPTEKLAELFGLASVAN